MQIERFHIQGFKSIADVEVDRLSDVNVFYGLNDTGRSNIFQALGLWNWMLTLLADTEIPPCACAGKTGTTTRHNNSNINNIFLNILPPRDRPQVCRDEIIDFTVKHAFGIACFVVRPVVFHHAVGV